MLQQHRKGVTFLPKFESGMENMADMFVFETGDLLEMASPVVKKAVPAPAPAAPAENKPAAETTEA